jgi:hypothetical protein
MTLDWSETFSDAVNCVYISLALLELVRPGLFRFIIHPWGF